MKTTNTIKVRIIQKLVADYFQIGVKTMLSRSRKDCIFWPRAIAMRLAYESTKLGLEDVGRLFNRGHATVLNALKTTADRMQTDARECVQLEDCRLAYTLTKLVRS
jgi:chromosomal replication initiator protein